MRDMPKPNKRSWKDAGRTQGLPNRGDREKKDKVDEDSIIVSLILCPIEAEGKIWAREQGCDHFGENHKVLNRWVMGWVVVSHVSLIWREHLLACQSVGSLMLFMGVHKSSSYSICARLWCSTCAKRRSASRFVSHKAVCIRRGNTVCIYHSMWQSQQMSLRL